MAKKDFKTSINQTNIPVKIGVKGLFSPSENLQQETLVTPVISKTLVTLPSDVDKEVRQTFIVKESYLEKLKDYVHLKRQQGFSVYTQKEALADALNAFFSQLEEIPSRPDFIKTAEQLRSSKIKNGL